MKTAEHCPARCRLPGSASGEVPTTATFREKLENGHERIAHTAGRVRNPRIRVQTGDKVQVEMTPHDLTKDRNTHRIE